MKVEVLFFGATAAVTGERMISVDTADGSSARSVLDSVFARFPDLRRHKLHLSINQQYAAGDEPVRDGDELAIFTAVSGG